MSKQQIEEYELFFGKAVERGANVLSFTCSGCGFENKSLAPEHEEYVWDSLVFCPSCEKAFFKVVTSKTIDIEEL